MSLVLEASRTSFSMLPGLNSYNLCLLLNTRQKIMYRLMGYKYEPPRTSQNEGFVGVPREWPQMQVSSAVAWNVHDHEGEGRESRLGSSACGRGLSFGQGAPSE